MREVKIKHFDLHFLRIEFVKDLRGYAIFELQEAFDIMNQIVEGKYPSIIVQDKKFDSLISVLDKFDIKYELK